MAQLGLRLGTPAAIPHSHGVMEVRTDCVHECVVGWTGCVLYSLWRLLATVHLKLWKLCSYM